MRPIVFISAFFFISAAFLLMGSGCLKDDFSKRAASEWNPDFAFPIVNSDLDVNDFLVQDNSPTIIGINDSNIVEIIYNSLAYSKRARDLVNLPTFITTTPFGMSAAATSTFNATTTNGSEVTDSVVFEYPYSLDPQLGVASDLDTVFFKSGILNVSIASQIPQNCKVRVEVPGLFINAQPFLQNIELNSVGQTPLTGNFNRNLVNSFLVLNSQEKLVVRFVITTTRTNTAPVPVAGQLIASMSIANPAFKRISGYFEGLQMPVINNDTLFLRIFKNVISATNLNFVNPHALIKVQNSTGIGVSATINSFTGYRPGVSIPPINLSGFTFPAQVAAQANYNGPPSAANFNLTNQNGSNIGNVINTFPRYMIASSNHTLTHGAPGTWGFLMDTSRVSIYSEVRLPLDGLTLNLQVLDTVDFDFNAVSSDIERAMLRLNITNGFPLEGALQLYFCKKTVNNQGQTTALTVLDSLYTGAELVLLSGVTDGNGFVNQSVNKVTDAFIEAEEWKRLSTARADAIIVRARMTTFNTGQNIVKIYETNSMNLRIAAQIKIRKTF